MLRRCDFIGCSWEIEDLTLVRKSLISNLLSNELSNLIYNALWFVATQALIAYIKETQKGCVELQKLNFMGNME